VYSKGSWGLSRFSGRFGLYFDLLFNTLQERSKHFANLSQFGRAAIEIIATHTQGPGKAKDDSQAHWLSPLQSSQILPTHCWCGARSLPPNWPQSTPQRAEVGL